MGQRATDPVPLQMAPGVVSNEADRDTPYRYKASNRVRFHLGRPEKIGGWVRQALTGSNAGVYVGVARALHDWSSLDTQMWIAIGTNCKLYLVNNAILTDITPLRKASTVHDPFTTTLSSTSVRVSDPDHRADVGDHIRVYSATAVGGVTPDGDYDIITVIDPDTYTITVSSPASSNATGGGDVTIEYDIGCGLQSNGELTGYGTGTYGEGTYGTPRPAGEGVPARLRTWSLDNWGEDLIASPSDGEIYWWDRSSGPNSRATLIDEAPTGVQRILVSPENRFLIAFGCSDLDGTFDPMRVRWCSQEDFNDWFPTDTNTAGGQRLDYGSRLITAVKSNKQILIWSDTQLYTMQFLGAPLVFGIDAVGKTQILGPNAAIDVNGVVYFLGFDNPFVYDGTLRPLPCEIWNDLFSEQSADSLDKTQAEKIHCALYETKSEVVWFWPSKSGGGEVDSYSAYNYVEGCWYGGKMDRTAYHDITDAISPYRKKPYGVNGGYLYVHEVGQDEVEGETTTVMDWFLETWDMSIGGSQAQVLLHHLIPNFKYFAGGMRVYVKARKRPRSAYVTKGPFDLLTTDEVVGSRARGSQIALRFQTGVDEQDALITGQDFRFGEWQVQFGPYGKR